MKPYWPPHMIPSQYQCRYKWCLFCPLKPLATPWSCLIPGPAQYLRFYCWSNSRFWANFWAVENWGCRQLSKRTRYKTPHHFGCPNSRAMPAHLALLQPRAYILQTSFLVMNAEASFDLKRNWWRWVESNHWLPDYDSGALTDWAT